MPIEEAEDSSNRAPSTKVKQIIGESHRTYINSRLRLTTRGKHVARAVPRDAADMSRLVRRLRGQAELGRAAVDNERRTATRSAAAQTSTAKSPRHCSRQ